MARLETRLDVLQQAFNSLNDMKRAKVLGKQSKVNGDYSNYNFHKLNEHDALLALELALRTLNKDLKESGQLEVPLHGKDLKHKI